MKKIMLIIFICCVGIFMCENITAGVHFIVQPSKSGKKSNPLPQTHTCLRSGYTLKTCPAGFFPNRRCPDDANFYDKCCDGKIYKYTSSGICAKIGMLPKDECGGKYSCVEY